MNQFVETQRAKNFKGTPLDKTYADGIRGIRVSVHGVREMEREEAIRY